MALGATKTSLQHPGCPSEGHIHVSSSGQARDALLKEEVSSIRGHPDTLHSTPLDFLNALQMIDSGTDSTGCTLPQAEAPVSLYYLPTSRNYTNRNTLIILHLGTVLEQGENMP